MTETPMDADYQAFLAWKAQQAQAAQAEEAANQPAQYYVHLADGRVEVLGEEEASQSHYNGVRVIDKYQVGD